MDFCWMCTVFLEDGHYSRGIYSPIPLLINQCTNIVLLLTKHNGLIYIYIGTEPSVVANWQSCQIHSCMSTSITPELF